MVLIIILLLSSFSSLIFQRLEIINSLKTLLNSYKTLFKILKITSLSDEEKQKKLIQITLYQFKGLSLNFIKLFLVTSPFLFLKYN